VSLVARFLESHGIATVVMGCALDIVTHCGVPRYVFSDLPLGHSAGKPFDRASQARTLSLALDLLETATAPRALRVSPERWQADDTWKKDYLDLERLTPAELAARRAEFVAQKAVARGLKGQQP